MRLPTKLPRAERLGLVPEESERAKGLESVAETAPAAPDSGLELVPGLDLAELRRVRRVRYFVIS